MVQDTNRCSPFQHWCWLS